MSCPIDGLSVCPCHHSVYDPNGDLVHGVAVGQPPLPHYLVEVQLLNGIPHVYVDSSVELADRRARI